MGRGPLVASPWDRRQEKGVNKRLQSTANSSRVVLVL